MALQPDRIPDSVLSEESVLELITLLQVSRCLESTCNNWSHFFPTSYYPRARELIDDGSCSFPHGIGYCHFVVVLVPDNFCRTCCHKSIVINKHDVKITRSARSHLYSHSLDVGLGAFSIVSVVG